MPAFCRNTPRCSSCRACEAAFGGEAVVKSCTAVYQGNFVGWNDDGFAAERSLASSTAATVLRCYGIAVGSSVWGRSWTPR